MILCGSCCELHDLVETSFEGPFSAAALDSALLEDPTLQLVVQGRVLFVRAVDFWTLVQQAC